MSNDTDTHLRPRLCHIIKWPDFQGYGFNLHAEKGKAGQFIGKVDEDSPASSAGLKAGDRIVEVNDVNIGNENHQQVVQRVKAGGDQTRLLVVDDETDQHFKQEKRVVRGDLTEVLHLKTQLRPGQEEPGSLPTPEIETTVINVPAPVDEPTDNNNTVPDDCKPRLCHLRKWPDFDGYGFNLHAEKNKPGQYIGKIDEASPAEKADLREGDRIIEVNGDNVEQEPHQNVIQKIKSGGQETKLLVVDKKTDAYYKDKGIQVVSSMPQVIYIATPERNLPETEILVHHEALQQYSHGIDDYNENGAPEPEVINTDNDICEEPSVEAVQSEVVETTPPDVDSQDTPEEVYIPEQEVVDIESSNVEAEEIPVTSDPPTYENNDVEDTPIPDPVTEVENTETEVVSSYENGYAATEVVSTEVEEPPSYQPSQPASDPTPPPPAPTTESNEPGRPSGMSAREYAEYLKNKRKPDPRKDKVDFRTKYEKFSRM